MARARGDSSVAVGILNWNGRQHLVHCLDALQDLEDPGVPWEVVVFDNGSSDGSVRWLEETYGPGARLGCSGTGSLRWIESPENLGFCGGNNRLVEQCEAESIAFLNNDTRPQPQWLRALVDSLRSAPADVASVCGRILDWEGQRLDFVQGVMTFDAHAFQRGYHRPVGSVDEPADGSECLFPCGGNMLVRRQSFVDAGAFDADYFAYLEDVDLGWRLWSGGERVLYSSDAVVHHRSMASSELLGLYNRGFLFERNSFLTAFKNYDDELWPQIFPCVLMAFLSRAQTLLVQNNQGGETLTIDPYRTPPSTDGVPAAAAPSTLERYWAGLRRRLARWLAPAGWVVEPAPSGDSARLADPRSIAQLRVVTYLLDHLDEAARKRAIVQGRRQRPDREIFERFPLYRVATYPGDDRLFASEGFRSWFPDDFPVVDSTLHELMDIAE